MITGSHQIAPQRISRQNGNTGWWS